VQIAETLVTQGTYMQQWRNLMRDFFTRSASRKNPATADLLKKIDAELQAAVRVDEAGADAVRARATVDPEEDLAPSMVLKLLADVADAAMLEPSPTNIQTVVNRLRDKVDLKFRGAAVFTPTGYRDASLEAGQVWQMSVDEQLAVAARVDDLVRTNPELLVQLTPLINEMTTASVAARQLEYQAPVATMKAVLSGLRDMAEASGVVINKKLYNEALLEVSNVVKAPAEAVGAMPSPKVKVAEDLSVKFAKRGVIHNVSNWTRGRLKTMSNRERLSMAETSLREMLTRKTLYPGGRGVRLITVGGTAGKKDAAFGYLGRILTAARYGRAGVQPDKASQFAVRTVRQMLDSGVDKSLITLRMVDDAMTAVDNIVADYIENQVRNTMRRYGFDSFSAPGSLERLTQTVIATPVDDAYAYAILPGMEDVFEKLHSYAATGRLLPLLNTLQGRTMLKERAAGDFLMSLLGDFVEGTRQTTAYGLLSAGLVVGGPAGVYPMMIPIARYIGLNLLTATGMMVGTLGSSRATRALGYAAADVARKIDETARGAARKAAQRVGLVNTVTPVPPNTVIFRDVYGKEWTRAEFDELCEMWNSYMSRAEVDQTFNVLRTMQRELGVIAKGDASLANAPWYRQASRYVNPFYEAPGMQFAVWTDTVFRRGAFASAIRDGYTPAQAAEIAKASVLDYGAVPDLLKQKFNKYLLFATFRAASTGAILQSLFAGRTEWLRVLRLQMQMHKAAETWTFGADHDKVRSFTIPGPQFDYRPTAVAGPQEVFASGAADYISALYFAGAFVVATATGDDSVGGDLKGRALTAVAEENIQPFFQLLLTLFANQRPSSRGRLVPDTWVAAMQNSNSWEWAVDRYQIEDINPTFNLEEMRPGAPTFEGSQYVFMGNGYRQFMIDQYLAMVLMAKRSTEDSYRGLAGSPYPPGEGYDPKYRAIVPFYLYLPGVATPIRLRSPEDIYQRALRQDIFR
jgi:hypothetical protein